MGDMTTGDITAGKRAAQDPGGKVAERKRREAKRDPDERVYEFTLKELHAVFAQAEKRQRRSPADFVTEERFNDGPSEVATQAKCERWIRFAKEIGLML